MTGKIKRCMFNHNVCIQEECMLYYDGCAFQKICFNVIENDKRNEAKKNERDFFDYTLGKNIYDIVIDIAEGRDILNSNAIDIFLDFLRDNKLFEDEYEIFDYWEEEDIVDIRTGLFIYKNAVKKLGEDNKGEIKKYFYDRHKRREETLNKRRYEKQRAEKEKREKELIASVGGFVKYLESVKAKKVFKKDVLYYYREFTKLNLRAPEDDLVIRHINDNNLYLVKK